MEPARGKAYSSESLEFNQEELVALLYELGEKTAPLYGQTQGGETDAFLTVVRLMDPGVTSNPSLEVRRTVSPEGYPGNCVQVALCARTAQERARARQALGPRALLGIEVALGGDVTLEFCFSDVSKANACHFALVYFDQLLQAMNYQRGSVIDARYQRMVVLSDADGTLYDKQETNPDNPLGANLANSPAREQLLRYLRLGGVLGICTGNDLERTRLRILQGIEHGEWARLLTRIFISANGGASMAVFDASSGRLRSVAGYGFPVPETGLKTALQVMEEPPRPGVQAVYLGHDARPSGNDYHVFKHMSPRRSICVADQHTSRIDGQLRQNHLNGGPRATGQFLAALNDSICRKRSGKGVFDRDSLRGLIVRARAALGQWWGRPSS
jgi:hypothetical protein